MFTIGADPELFLQDVSTGKFISAVGKFGGTKHQPKLIRDDGCAIQEDNVAVEFNIPPCTSRKDFIESLEFNMEYIQARAKELGLILSIVASADFDKQELNTLEACTFGCEPDYNAWTIQMNPRPKARLSLRSCGGHVHLQGVENIEPYELIRCMDVSLGLWSVTVDHDQDRRKLYGKAGAHRPKVYGVEYRTLSNFWLKSRDLMSEVYDRSEFARNSLVTKLPEINRMGKQIQLAINKGDAKSAQELLVHFGC